MDAKCASDEMDAFSKCKESCSLSSDGKEIETDSECCPWGNDSIDRRTTPRLDELFPTRKASVKHLEMLDMKKQSKNGKVSKANSKPIVHSSKSKETPKRTVSKIKPAEGAKSKALKKQKEIFPQISARTIPLSASIGYKSERKPIKKEWNFDTKITRDAKPKRRPMSALEINRKVQVLIKRTALEKVIFHSFQPSILNLKGKQQTSQNGDLSSLTNVGEFHRTFVLSTSHSIQTGIQNAFWLQNSRSE